MPTRSSISLLLVLVLLAVACGDDDTSLTTGDTSVSTDGTASRTAADGDTIGTPEYLAFRSQAVACGAEAPPEAAVMSFSGPDELGLQGTTTAVITTSCGDITIELDSTAAPATVNSFVFLSEEGYFDGTVSHRVASGFVIQLGDPEATGRGGPGYTIPDELPIQPGFIYTRGTVAMANAGPNTSGSQFFLVLQDAPLPPSFSVFGTVTSGLDVMDAIAAVPTVARAAGLEPSSPTQTIYIETVTIQR